MEKKNIDHYFLFFVIFSKSLKQKCLIPTESCFLDGKKPNIAKLDNGYQFYKWFLRNMQKMKTGPKKKYLSSLFSIFCDFL